VIAASVADAEVTIREHLSGDTLLILGTYAFDGGKTLDLTVGIGSGAFRAVDDPPNTIWTVSDRGDRSMPGRHSGRCSVHRHQT
jgi:hypothetical protein